MLLLHGFIEVLGALITPLTTEEFLPSGLMNEKYFWMAISAVYGISRLITGYEVWMMRKWGIALGVVLSTTTMIIAPSIIPFGIMDSMLAIVTLASILIAWFGDEKL